MIRFFVDVIYQITIVLILSTGKKLLIEMESAKPYKMKIISCLRVLSQAMKMEDYQYEIHEEMRLYEAHTNITFDISISKILALLSIQVLAL